MTKGEAVAQVAGHMASWMSASTLSEATGVQPWELEQMSEADKERLDWAAGEVERRLWRMGKRS